MTFKNNEFGINPGFISSRNALGRQLTIEYYDCVVDRLVDSNFLERIFVEAAKESGATIINSSFHTFNPHGVSGVVIIAESHFTVHTWPEHHYAAVDIFTCGSSIDLQKAIQLLEKHLAAGHVKISSDIGRGFFKDMDTKTDTGAYSRTLHENITSWQKEYETEKPWGVLSSIDIYECRPHLIQDKNSIREFVHRLCDLIQMKKFGECRIVHFGEDERIAGFSVTQLIETSLISGHFANASGTAYLDIFSCRFYEPEAVANFALDYFGGSHYNLQIALRR